MIFTVQKMENFLLTTGFGVTVGFIHLSRKFWKLSRWRWVSVIDKYIKTRNTFTFTNYSTKHTKISGVKTDHYIHWLFYTFSGELLHRPPLFTMHLLPWIFLAAVSTSSAATIGILPIVDCPSDTDPYVIVTTGFPNLAANQYVVCFQGSPFIFNCSEGLFFNPSTFSCDFPYERRNSDPQGSLFPSSSSSEELDLIPAGPIPVPISPQFPVPIWSRRQSLIPPFPITKPNPAVINPVPVLPAHPPPLIPRPVPYYWRR